MQVRGVKKQEWATGHGCNTQETYSCNKWVACKPALDQSFLIALIPDSLYLLALELVKKFQEENQPTKM